ncbi:MAG: cell division protein FtsA [Myxococcota bacterium]
MPRREEIIVGLDIGTTRVAAVVGEVGDDGIDIIGVGTAASSGLAKGVVVNIDATVASIRRAIEEAAQMAGCQIDSVYVGIGGGHIMALNSHGMHAVKGREIREPDVAGVLENSKAIHIPGDREIIHVLPQEFIVDQQDGIRDPVGMSGVRLEAKVHVVTALVTSVENIVKCCNRCGLSVAGLVLQPLASAEAVLHEDEKELGVCLVDIGGGTTDLALYHGSAIVHTVVLPVGGHQLTADIAFGVRTPRSEAERLKQKSGCAMISMIGDDETIDVPSVGGRSGRTLPRKLLGEILEPRVEEILQLIHKSIESAGYEDLLGSGIVLTGGTSLLEGIVELGEHILGVPVRRSMPRGVGGMADVVRSPAFSTGVGLVLYGARQAGAAAKPTKRWGDWLRELFE